MDSILIADDDLSILRMVRHALENEGYVVFAACDGLQALELFENRGGEITAAVMDVNMPVMDGIEAATRMREVRPGLPVIVVSGYESCGVLERLGTSAPVAYLPKPFSPRQLIEQLHATLSGCGQGGCAA